MNNHELNTANLRVARAVIVHRQRGIAMYASLPGALRGALQYNDGIPEAMYAQIELQKDIAFEHPSCPARWRILLNGKAMDWIVMHKCMDGFSYSLEVSCPR